MKNKLILILFLSYIGSAARPRVIADQIDNGNRHDINLTISEGANQIIQQKQLSSYARLGFLEYSSTDTPTQIMTTLTGKIEEFRLPPVANQQWIITSQSTRQILQFTSGNGIIAFII